ncbi:MAG: amidohydrolase family protein [Pyrinomonadaceae bacterium]
MKILSADHVLPISAAPISKGAVLIEKDVILAVGTAENLKKDYPAAEAENFGEAVIMPGLVNAHSHLELTAMRGFLDHLENDFSAWLLTLSKTRGEKLSDEDIEISAIWGALEGLRGGVTCFADIGRYGEAGFEALKKTGLRGIVYQETEFSPVNSEAENDFARLEKKFLALKENETALVKAGISPHSPYTVSRRLFEIIGEYAVRENVPLSIHAAESKAELEFMLYGTGFFARIYEKFGVEWQTPALDTIRYLEQTGILRAKPLLAHCVKVTDENLNIISKTDSRIAHCPKSNAKFGHGVAPFEKFLTNKLRVGFGSDSAASNNICDILEEARFASFFSRAREDCASLISAREIIETAALGGARALGLETEIGTLETGKQADLIVISLKNAAQQPVHDIYSALLFASSARDNYLTMVAGEEIYRDGIAKTVDETELKTKMNEIARKMNLN